MATIGNGSLSIRKKDLENQKNLALSFRNTVFAHKATAGDTSIDLTALTTPTELTSLGFVQPSLNEITAGKLLFNRKNLKLISSLKGELVDYLSYRVVGNTRIVFEGFEAEEGEIFTGTISPAPSTGNQVVDASPLIQTGTLDSGESDFTVGQAFEIQKYPNEQVGAVLVFLDGVLQYRNVGNATAAPGADGNYQEVAAGPGLANIIRFNVVDAVNDRAVTVISNGLLVTSPTDSRDQVIESLATQIDTIIPDLALVAGTSTSKYQSSPNQVDLAAFGTRVHQLETYRTVISADSASKRTGRANVDRVLFDTSAGAGTFILPASPQIGDWVEIWDAEGTFNTNNLTVDRNGNNIEGAASDFTASTDDQKIKFVYVSSSRGWIVGDLS